MANNKKSDKRFKSNTEYIDIPNKEYSKFNNTKKSDKRFKSNKEYINILSKEYSKLNNIRIDLGYQKPYSETTTLERANKDLNHMWNNTRSIQTVFGDKVGYICKIEYTEDKGIHFHLLIPFNGHKVKNSAYKAEQIGQYWEKITEGRGSYHNCHRNEYERNGIGMLDRNDSNKRKILDEVVLSYLCKDDQGIDSISNSSKDRAFKRGIIRKV